MGIVFEVQTCMVCGDVGSGGSQRLFKALVSWSLHGCWRTQVLTVTSVSLGIRGFSLGQIGSWLEGPEVSRACSKL